jgi:membrane protein DedA with SNARE-associated domain
MPNEFVLYINHYGYLAIFVLVLIQEIGIPTPLPNELLMLFSGYLAFSKVPHLWFVLLTVAAADFLGANILYHTFFFFGPAIIRNKPKWFPLSTEKINNISDRIANGGLWSVFIGRLTPFIRGYISVIVGLLHIKQKKYIPITLITAVIVTCTYVTIGYLLGPYWQKVAAKITTIKYGFLFLVSLVAVIMLVKHFIRKRRRPETNASTEI